MFQKNKKANISRKQNIKKYPKKFEDSTNKENKKKKKASPQE